MTKLLTVAVLFVALGGSALAQPRPRCSRETLLVRSAPVTASYCVTAASSEGSDLNVSVDEGFSAPHGSFSQTSTLRFLKGVESSRVIQDVELTRLGLEGTLHLTLVLRGSTVHIESALLTPGAVTIK